MAEVHEIESSKDVTPRFAFLIISAQDRTFRILKFAQLITWIRDFRSIAPVYFVEGNRALGNGVIKMTDFQDVRKLNDGFIVPVPNSQLRKFRNNNFMFDSVDGWDAILPNTIGALKEISRLEKYDYIIRTNLSSYWDAKRTCELIRSLPKSGVYAGPTRELDGLLYVEGDAIIMSRDTVDLILENQRFVDNRVADDVSIANTMKQLGVRPIEIERPWVLIQLKRFSLSCHLNSKSELTHYSSFRFPRILLSFANLRCKNPHQILGYSIRMDPLIFIVLKIVFFLRKQR